MLLAVVEGKMNVKAIMMLDQNEVINDDEDDNDSDDDYNDQDDYNGSYHCYNLKITTDLH